MREKLIILLLGWAAWTVSAQTGNEVFSFLRLPNATRANALGGHTVALIERDPSLVFHNPGLLGAEMDGMINFNYMNYIADVNVGTAGGALQQPVCAFHEGDWRAGGLGRGCLIHGLWQHPGVFA